MIRLTEVKTIKHDPAKEKCTADTIESAQRTVRELNKALEERFGDVEETKIIAWTSDIHVHADAFFGRAVDSTRQFSLALQEIHAKRPVPELLVLGGDLTDNGTPEEFQTFYQILQSQCRIPTILVFGNHDNMKPPIHPGVSEMWPNIRQADCPEMNDPDELYYSITKAGFKLLVLDTQQENSYRMPEKQKEWLRAELLGTDQSIIIFCHRHQLPVGNWVDEESMFRDREVWDIIDRTPNVLGIFSGHVHSARLWQFRRKLYGTFPAVAYGIGDYTGWGGIVLQQDRIAGVSRKISMGKAVS